MHSSLSRRGLAAVGATIAAAALATASPAFAHGTDHGYGHGHDHGQRTSLRETDLLSSIPGRAAVTDPNLKNAWGMSHGPNTPLWISENGSDTTPLFTTPATGPAIAPTGLNVAVPGGAPTGQTFNDTTGFAVPGTNAPALFIFASENGVISAWNRSVAPATQAIQVASVTDAVFKGIAIVHSPFGPLLLATDFHHNRVDVFDSSFHLLSVDRLFRDGALPRGYAPFNVAEIGDKVYVTYAKQDADRHDDVAGAGHGFIDVYTNYGAFLHRFSDHEALNSPWGLAVAPSSFGDLAGDLLVGNFGDGRIHAFDLASGRLVGTVHDSHGRPIQIDGLWGLLQGDDVAGGTDALWFSAGPNDEADGLVGLLKASN